MKKTNFTSCLSTVRSVAVGVAVGTVVWCGSVALAQNQPSIDQLQTMYQDALNQLKDAQNRKNELATRNQELQKKLADTETERDRLNERLMGLETTAYYLREHYSAWQEFIDQNPPLRVMWFTYFTSGELMENVENILGDGKWPFGVE